MIEVTSSRDTILNSEDGIDYFSLSYSISFADLKIVGNTAGTVSAIRLESNNQLLDVVKDIGYSDITETDFVQAQLL